MADDDILEALARLGRYGDSLQKLCDAEDWADPRFRLVVRRGLGRGPRIHPRQWEQAAAFLALAEAGMLRREARGIAFGSGREPLTYAVAARAGQLTATDLYEAGTAWAVARTADPLGFVLGAAPAGFPAERLAVQHMDMREIAYPDACFDFCYSISAFEHIGEDPDFLRHLREVRRVLKPGGLYALTTEVLLGRETRRTRGNYAFTVDHLLRLFAEAGLQAAPVVEMRLSDFEENAPRPLQGLLHEDPAEPLLQGLTLRDLASCISAPVLFLLRPAQGAVRPVAVRGLAETVAAAERARIRLREARFADWVRLNPFGQQPAQARRALDLWARTPLPPGEPLFATRNADLGPGQVELQLVAAPSPAMPARGVFALRVFASRPGSGEPPRLVHQARLTLNDPAGMPAVHRAAFAAAPDVVHALYGRVLEGEVLLAGLDIQLRRAGAAAPG
jgi:SAM-dependent methyltransferase